LILPEKSLDKPVCESLLIAVIYGNLSPPVVMVINVEKMVYETTTMSKKKPIFIPFPAMSRRGKNMNMTAS